MKHTIHLLIILIVSACTGYPDKLKPVDHFELDKYLGTWYEIARLDHSFERGLEQVTATYSMRDDGGVNVLNSGFDANNNEWHEAEGKAFFVQADDIAHLKVSFFWPFYGAYVVFYLDDDYQTAFVVGNDLSYLWLLSRTASITPETRAHFLQMIHAKGFNSAALIWVKQQ